jgi:uncharacterized peroxidase-related enzyme
MPFVPYTPDDRIPAEEWVPDKDNVLRIHGIHSRVMRLHYDLYVELMRGPSPLTRAQREMIAVAVSAANGCAYCLAHHGENLRRILVHDGRVTADAAGFVEALVSDYRTAPLEPSDKAMLDYAAKLTHAPGVVAETDVSRLRASGFDDRAIHDICLVAAYFAFATRIAEGLGVDLEQRFEAAPPEAEEPPPQPEPPAPRTSRGDAWGMKVPYIERELPVAAPPPPPSPSDSVALPPPLPPSPPPVSAPRVELGEPESGPAIAELPVEGPREPAAEAPGVPGPRPSGALARPRPPRRLVHRHHWIVRLTHWVNTVLLVGMIGSGLQIYNAYERFGIRGTRLPAPNPFDMHPFPHWARLGGWLAGGLNWHFFLMWPLVLNALLYLGYLIVTREWRSLVFRPRDVVPAIQMQLYYLRLRKEHPPQGKHNALQKAAYCLIFLLGVASVLTGLSLWKPVQLAWLTGLFGGYEWARYWHFVAVWLFVAFTLVHVTLVFTVDPASLRGMITGWYRGRFPSHDD